MRETVALQRKKYEEGKAERLLVRALRGRGGNITQADASALTGLAASEAEQALKSLIGRYRCHLAVTEQGELIYSFDRKLERRDKVPLRDRLAAVGRGLWRGFKVFFKIWIAVTLVVYVVAFLAMAIGLIVARTASDRDDRRDDGGGFGFPWLIFWLMPDWAPAQRGYRQVSRKPTKRFYKSVFDFVFGPPKTPTESLAAEREMVAYIRSLDGRLTVTDMVALTGWSYNRAEEELTRLLADYDGEPEVDDNGVVIFSFPALRRTTGEKVDSNWRFTWQEDRSLVPLTGNTSGANTLVAVLNSFNLVAGLTIGPAFLSNIAQAGVPSNMAELLVFWFPMTFSTLFFAIPTVRWLLSKADARNLRLADLRAALVREAIANQGIAVPPTKLLAAATRKTAQNPMATKVLDRLLVDLEGDVSVDESSGAVNYSFPRVAEELQAGKAARRAASQSEVAPGKITFSSKDDSLN